MKNRRQAIKVLNDKIVEIKIFVAESGNFLSPVYARAINMLADAIILGASEELEKKTNLKLVK